MNKTFALAMLAAFATAPGAAAEGLDYQYLQAGFVKADHEGTSGDGYSVLGSLEIGEHSFVALGYASLVHDSAGVELESDDTSFSVGMHTALTANVDLVGQLGLHRSVVDVTSVSVSGGTSDTGALGSLGVRALLAPRVELAGEASAVNIHDETDVAFSLTARLLATENFSVLFRFASQDHLETTMVALRFGI